MPSPARRHLAFAAGIGVSFLLVYLLFHSLSALRTTIHPEGYVQRIAVSLAVFMLPILTTWWRFKWAGVNIMMIVFVIPLVFFVVTVTKIPVFLWCSSLRGFDACALPCRAAVR